MALERAGGNISKAANILQLSRSTLSSKILKKKS
ncbi:MAG: helix-turn-helix domain-containing protein [Gammaproteobacteria bacterium]